MALMLRVGPYVRAAGSGTGMTGPLGATRWPLIAVLLAAVALTGTTLGWALVPALGGLIAAQALIRAWALKRLGGLTGDVLGAAQVLGDLGFLLGVLAWR
ncbi:adenosylcobinamide-GDP ribazoletransferase [Pararhodobacter zhoushanensis]|uniref:Adenosylcobinamide-GDP ribazoletransferase n=1 Tax=Pararhodobacter zhoushanensis TaxID=2479545 RepID=A0ABT3GYV2_9RHOB|nr:adenosylcobinamide-GDP ribazoletransferase [Pararhodobacter zhoushanensis]MCW1932706.1 adenosylcobinamide-GDP ribazoletransferase [Pararhodobacter zhoushanensis]